MTLHVTPGDPNDTAPWLTSELHRAWLKDQAHRQFQFFLNSVNDGPGFCVLDHDGQPLPSDVQELHTTTRLVHSYALALRCGEDGAERIIDHGMSYLWSHHRDAKHGGYVWSLDRGGIHDETKLAYGHVFTMLAGASAKIIGHPDADRLIEDVWAILDDKFWEDDHGLFADEFNRDWTPFSKYRGMNANMHGVEALLTAFEATGEAEFLNRAGRILDFFVGKIAPAYGWRLPEHYDANWVVDTEYAGNPMFRPKGTTPGHSFELARLQLQHWDLCGRPQNGADHSARRLFDTAVKDAWHDELGGFIYTLTLEGEWDNQRRFWWPVTEAIGALAAFMKVDPAPGDERLYRQLWTFANGHLIDHRNAGWFPELDEANQLASTQFDGKPDIYHAIQALLFPLAREVSHIQQTNDW